MFTVGPALWSAQNDPYAGMVLSHFHFDDTSGTTVPADSAGILSWSNTSSGSVSTAVSKFGAGSFHKGATSGAGGLIASLSSISGTSANWTWEGWVRFSTLASSFIGCRFLEVGGPVLGYSYSTKLLTFQREAVGDTFSTSFTLSADTWYYIAIVTDSTSTKVWVDGSVAYNHGSRVGVASVGSPRYGICACPSGNGAEVTSTIDEARLTVGVARDVSVVPTAPFA
jgi:hypothetical protein